MHVKHLEIFIVSREAFKIDFKVYITSSKHKLNNSPAMGGQGLFIKLCKMVLNFTPNCGSDRKIISLEKSSPAPS